MMNSSRLESFIASAVQMAHCASQSWVTGRTTVTSPLESSSTVICQRRLEPGSGRCALTIVPPVTSKVSSRRRWKPSLTSELKSISKVNAVVPSWVVGRRPSA